METNNDKEHWLSNVLDSLEGSQRAQPGKDLFAKIEKKVLANKAQVIPIYRVKIAASVAVLVILINIFSAINYHNETASIESVEVLTDDSINQNSLISNYKIYDL